MVALSPQFDLSATSLASGGSISSRAAEPTVDFASLIDRSMRGNSSASPDRQPRQAEPSSDQADARQQASDARPDSLVTRNEGSRNNAEPGANAPADTRAEREAQSSTTSTSEAAKKAEGTARTATQETASAADGNSSARDKADARLKSLKKKQEEIAHGGSTAMDVGGKPAAKGDLAKKPGIQAGAAQGEAATAHGKTFRIPVKTDDSPAQDQVATKASFKASTGESVAKKLETGNKTTEQSEARPGVGASEQKPRDKKGEGLPALADGQTLTGAELALAQLAKAQEGQPAGTQGKATDPKKDNPDDAAATPASQAAHKAQPQAQITVVDLRSAASHTPVQQGSDPSPQAGTPDFKHNAVEVRLVQLDAGPRSPQTARFDAPSMSARQDSTTALQQSWNNIAGQIVRGTGVVLKDNNSGEIRLVMKPENLGSVRIRLDMKDNLVTGKIFVDNDSVRQLFQQNLDSLYRALRDGGFQTGMLNVSVGGRDAGERERGRHSPLPGNDLISGVKSLDAHVPGLQFSGVGDSMINLMV